MPQRGAQPRRDNAVPRDGLDPRHEVGRAARAAHVEARRQPVTARAAVERRLQQLGDEHEDAKRRCERVAERARAAAVPAPDVLLGRQSGSARERSRARARVRCRRPAEKNAGEGRRRERASEPVESARRGGGIAVASAERRRRGSSRTGRMMTQAVASAFSDPGIPGERERNRL